MVPLVFDELVLGSIVRDPSSENDPIQSQYSAINGDKGDKQPSQPP